MTMTMTARVTGGEGIGGQRVSKAPPSPQHIETTKGRGEGEVRSIGKIVEMRGAGRCVCLWGGMVNDGRGSCFTRRAVYRGTIAEAAGLRLGVLVRSGGLMIH